MSNLIDISTSDWSAIQPDDYSEEDETEVTFDAGTPSVEVSITTIDDSEIEHDEQFVVMLLNPTVGAIGVLKKTVIVIKDANTPGKM